MKAEVRSALAFKLLAIADDEIVLGQRNAEWCGHAPILEEDIAFANIALDEIGHAGIWYGILAILKEADQASYPDKLVYHRPANEFCNTQLVSLPKGDWAHTIMRQYLYDLAESLQLEYLEKSKYEPLAAAAAKIHREEIYHLRHNSAWVRRLGLGSEESHQRIQTALNALWPYALQLFVPLENETLLVESGIAPDSNLVEAAWRESAQSFLEGVNLTIPNHAHPIVQARSEQSRYQQTLVAELQSVARLLPNANW